jgi:alkylhydroperoxidase/carboxymuconolactone decarboxylase family protein YurZ
MRNIMIEAPAIAEGFFALTRDIKSYVPMDEKTNELILVGIFAASGGIRGIGTHAERAMQLGATKEEILGAVFLALPVVGISNITQSVEKVLETLNQQELHETSRS